MEIRVKNNDTVSHTWGGKEFSSGEEYVLQRADFVPFITSTTLFTDVGSGKALIGNLNEYYSDPIAGWEYLEHEGKEDEVKVTELPEPKPFAVPEYRTKRNATGDLVTVSPGETETIDFKLTAERYVSGGVLIVENAEFGDYCTAEVRDIDGVIPEAYRSSLCEDHPTVAKYVEKEFVKIRTPGSIQSGSISCNEINTYPLNAKITSGLYLRITYTAVNSGLDRRIAVNYFLTKKL